jgi:Domain of unknown function (DUF4276)
MEISYTLLSDGTSDRALMPILTWLLQQNLSNYEIQSEWADLRRLDKSLRDTLKTRMELSVKLYPCDLLFVHRDAEKEPYANRVTEIQAAISKATLSAPVVCVIPVRMTEAWLFSDVAAIRKAASNPNGKIPLTSPPIKKIEGLPDPKEDLYALLRQASGLSPSRLRRFSVQDRVYRVSELTSSFTTLRKLAAFSALESDLKAVIQQQGW